MRSFSSGNIPEWYEKYELDTAQIETHTDEYMYRSTTTVNDEPILDAFPHLGVDRKDTRGRLEYFARLARQYFVTGDRRTRGSV
jgi:hypothetical protein